MTSPTDSARKRPIKRKNLKVKRFRFLKPDLSKSSSSKSPGGSFNNSSQYERGILRKKNRQLAATLNDVRLTNAALCKKVNELNGLNLDLHAEVADLRKEVQGLRLSSVKSRSSEADIHRRQAEMLAPVLTSLRQAFDHTLGLSDNLTSAMHMIESQRRRSSQIVLGDDANSSKDDSIPTKGRPVPKMSMGNTIREGRASTSGSNWRPPPRRSNLNFDDKPKSEVSPRVGGHEIHKPSIRIERLDMADYREQLRQEQQGGPPEPPQNGGRRQPQRRRARRPQVEEEQDQDDAEERETVQDNNVDTTNDQEEEEEEDPPMINFPRPRRRSHVPPNMSIVEEMSAEDESDSDVANISVSRQGSGGETVLLFPRLVLERITLSPGQSIRSVSRRQSVDPVPPPDDRDEVGGDDGGNDADGEEADDPNDTTTGSTPRTRESFDDFTRRMCGINPMEGPSWLFEDEPPSTPNRNRNRSSNSKKRPEKKWTVSGEKSKSIKLKARLSGASKRLSMTEQRDSQVHDQEGETEESVDNGDNTLTNDNVNVNDDTANNTDNDSVQVPAEQDQVQDEPEPVQQQEEEPPRRRGRAAAAAARNSLKEKPINSKLRQGDPSTTSVYDDFKPGTKRKSDTKSSKTTGSSTSGASKKKKSSEK